MDSFVSQAQFGKLRRSIESTGFFNLSIDFGGDSMYAKTKRAEMLAATVSPEIAADFTLRGFTLTIAAGLQASTVPDRRPTP